MKEPNVKIIWNIFLNVIVLEKSETQNQISKFCIIFLDVIVLEKSMAWNQISKVLKKIFE